MITFPCTQCGICCQNIQGIDSLSHLNRGDGCCIHYDIDNRSCKIYEERPLLCNIELAYEELFKKSISKKDLSGSFPMSQLFTSGGQSIGV